MLLVQQKNSQQPVAKNYIKPPTPIWRESLRTFQLAHTMVTGTDIYTLWKGYLLRGVGRLASMDIRYVEEAIKKKVA